jgi:hypothetical protein
MNMPLGKGFCHCINVKTTLELRLVLHDFLGMKAVTHWNQVQVKIRNTHAAVSFVALANLRAVSRALNAVFISIIFVIPARGVLCLVANHPTFPTIIDYSHNRQLLMVASLLTWRSH